MRARSIKPGICDNEVLGTADPFYTLLFERLWMIADREGRLEDRPLRIKAQAFPYRDGLDVEPMLKWLTKEGFISRYEAGGKRIIQVLMFSRHQSPHKNEQGSVLPPMEAHASCKVIAKHNHGSAMDALTPSSLTADCLPPDSSITSASATPADDSPEWWDEFKSTYPSRAGDQGWRKAQRAAHARISEGHTPIEMIDGARRYRAFCDLTQKIGTEYVKQACTFLGPDKPFTQPWKAPPTKAQARQDRSVNATLQWLSEEDSKDAPH